MGNKQQYGHYSNILDIIITDGEYQTYTDRLLKFQQDIKEMQNFNIPQGFNFRLIEGLSQEIFDRLKSVNPRSLYEIKDLKGITPAAFMMISKYFSK